jgi:hypothetical protein
MPMGDRLAFFLGYGALFVAASLWIAHRFLLRDQEKVALAAQGGSALAAILLGLGLALRGFRVGYWPFHTAHELLAVGLLGLLLASLTLLLPRRDGLLLLILSALSSLLAVYGLLVGCCGTACFGLGLVGAERGTRLGRVVVPAPVGALLGRCALDGCGRCVAVDDGRLAWA